MYVEKKPLCYIIKIHSLCASTGNDTVKTGIR